MSNRLQIAVSQTLKAIRLQKKMSQEALAERCELDRTYVSGIERQVRNPTIKTINRIISALKVTELEFLKLVSLQLEANDNEG